MFEVNEIIDNEDKRPNVNLIEDNNFMDKDVSELVKGNFYLFHMTKDKMYFYTDGVVTVGSLLDDCGGVVQYEYKEGTLQSCIERLEGGL